MKFGPRRPSFRKSFAARTSPKRIIKAKLGLHVPRGYGWLTNPRRAAYSRVYNRTTFSVWNWKRLPWWVVLGLSALIYMISRHG